MNADVTRKLTEGRAMAWPALRPAFDHALALAREAEHLAGHTSIECQTSVRPAYPPLVLLLADAAPNVGVQP